MCVCVCVRARPFVCSSLGMLCVAIICLHVFPLFSFMVIHGIIPPLHFKWLLCLKNIVFFLFYSSRRRCQGTPCMFFSSFSFPVQFWMTVSSSSFRERASVCVCVFATVRALLSKNALCFHIISWVCLSCSHSNPWYYPPLHFKRLLCLKNIVFFLFL